jgi:hypothetical protein
VTDRRGLGWEAVASHLRKMPKNKGKSSRAVSGRPVSSASGAEGRRFESCRARQPSLSYDHERATAGRPSERASLRGSRLAFASLPEWTSVTEPVPSPVIAPAARSGKGSRPAGVGPRAVNSMWPSSVSSMRLPCGGWAGICCSSTAGRAAMRSRERGPSGLALVARPAGRTLRTWPAGQIPGSADHARLPASAG